MINEAGRQQLIDALRKWAAHYDQTSFGKIIGWKKEGNDCGTMMCMAGMALLLKVGWDLYLSLIHKRDTVAAGDVRRNNEASFQFADLCIEAGKELLGLPAGKNDHYVSSTPEIFCDPTEWPKYFRDKYREALVAGSAVVSADIGYQLRDRALAEVAIEALMAMDEFGRLPHPQPDPYFI